MAEEEEKESSAVGNGTGIMPLTNKDPGKPDGTGDTFKGDEISPPFGSSKRALKAPQSKIYPSAWTHEGFSQGNGGVSV